MGDSINQAGDAINEGGIVNAQQSNNSNASVNAREMTEAVNNNMSSEVYTSSAFGMDDEDDDMAIEIATLDELSKGINTPLLKGKEQEEEKEKRKPFFKKSEGDGTNTNRKYKRPNKKLKRIRNIVITLAVIALALYLLIQYSAYKITKEFAKFDAVTEVDSIERRDISETISTTGTIQSKDVRTLTSSLGQLTTIESVNVEVGDIVEKGDIVVTFSRENIDKRIANLEEDIDEANATKNLDAGNRERNYSYNYGTEAYNINNANTRVTQQAEDLVKAQNDLAEACADKSDFVSKYERAVANVDAARIEMEQAQNAYSVWKNVFYAPHVDSAEWPQIKATAEQILSYYAYLTDDDAWADFVSEKTTTYQEYKATIDSYDNTIKSLNSVIETRKSNLTLAQRNYDSALTNAAEQNRTSANRIGTYDYEYNRGNLTAGDSVTNLQRQMEEYQDSIDDYIVYAPISGVVTNVVAEEGNGWMSSAGSLMTIQAIDMFEVKTQIDEYDINKVQQGQKVVIKTDATGDDELIGVVSFISPTATASVASASTTSSAVTYEVDINVVTMDPRLKLGMSAKLNIIINQHADTLAVRYDAIEENENGEKVVYIMPAEEAKKIQEKSDFKNVKAVEKKKQKDIDKKNGKDVDDDEDEQTFIQYLFSKKDTEALDEGADIKSKAKEVKVQVGLEDDYYTEISSSGIKEGDYILVNNKSGNMLDGLEMMFNASMDGRYGMD